MNEQNSPDNGALPPSAPRSTSTSNDPGKIGKDVYYLFAAFFLLLILVISISAMGLGVIGIAIQVILLVSGVVLFVIEEKYYKK